MPLGFLLVGGASGRMRRAKELLPWHGVPIYQHLSSVLGAVCAEVILVGHRVPPDWKGRTLADAVAQAGPLGGLLAALQYPGDPWRLVVACDMPLVEVPLLEGLCRQRAGDFDAIVPATADGQLHPLCALYQARVAGALERLLADSAPGAARRPSVHAFLRMLHVREWRVSDSSALANANSMRDYLALLGNHRPPSAPSCPRRGESETDVNPSGKNLKE